MVGRISRRCIPEAGRERAGTSGLRWAGKLGMEEREGLSV